MRTLFENENWIVVEKPSGWLTTPARDKADPRPCLGLKLQAQQGRQIYPVHRLDFEVGGLVLFAKNAQAHKVSQTWFEQGTVVKTYAAETLPGKNEAPKEWVTWTSQLLRGKRRAYVSPNGKNSVTRARVVRIQEDSWSWELEPHTGRPHQLRVELANHGCPILGDELYGGPKGNVPDSIALRAVTLNFQKVSEAERAGLPEIIHLV